MIYNTWIKEKSKSEQSGIDASSWQMYNKHCYLLSECLNHFDIYIDSNNDSNSNSNNLWYKNRYITWNI